jgi:hypothetical protein
MAITCPYCHNPAELVSGGVIYPHRPDLHSRRFWRCAPCDAYVGCHPAARRYGKKIVGVGDGTVPLGRLANAELRKAKQAAHDAFDPLWQSGNVTRKAAYAWLAKKLNIEPVFCHIGMFDVDACRAVVAAVAEGNREARHG